MRLNHSIVWIFLGLSACGADTPLLGDYALYDIGGSNQTILSKQGDIAAQRVTALALKDPYIYVESSGIGDRLGCSYKLIDTSNHSVIELTTGTLGSREAIVAIKTQKREVMPRSCVFRP